MLCSAHPTLQMRRIDQLSLAKWRLLMLSIIRRTDKFSATFGDADPTELDLGWGPSLNHSNSACLYAFQRPCGCAALC